MTPLAVAALRRLSGPVPLEADGGVKLEGKGVAPLYLGAADVRALERDGLVEREDGLLRRTEAGRTLLRRALAGGEGASRPLLTAGPEGTVANAGESPLAWLATRRDKSGAPLLTAEQVTAGARLHRDHARGRQQPRVGQSWDMSGVRGGRRADGLTVSEAAEDARRRVDGALAAVGPGLADVLVGVCCEEMGLEAVERRHQWPARSGKVVLRLALDRLALHYGIGGAAVGGPVPMAHWGAEGYRPRG